MTPILVFDIETVPDVDGIRRVHVIGADVPDGEVGAWFGLFAPAGTPNAIIDKLQAEVAKIVREPDIRERMAALGGEPVGSTPDQFAAIVKGDVAKWKKVVKGANIHVD